MNFQANLATRSRENLKKPQKTSFLGIKGPKKKFGDFCRPIGLCQSISLIKIQLPAQKLRNP